MFQKKKSKKNIVLTVDKFIQTIRLCQTGDKGLCKLASVSIGKDGASYNIGFRFKVIKRSGSIILSIKMESFMSVKPEQIIVISTEKQLYSFVEDMRQWAVDELSKFLY